MPKAFDDGVTTLTESNFNKLLVGDGTVGDGNGVACFGGYIYWDSGTNFVISNYWGATNIYDDMAVSWDGTNNVVALDLSGITNLFKTPGYGPVCVAQQDIATTPYHIQVASASTLVWFKFVTTGASPAVVTVPDANMNFHFVLWGYLKA